MSPKSLFLGGFSCFSTPTYRKLLLVEVYPLCLLAHNASHAWKSWALLTTFRVVAEYTQLLLLESYRQAEYLAVDNQNWESRKCGTPPFDIRQKVMTFGPSKRSTGSLFDDNSTFYIEETASFPLVKNWDNFLVKWYTYKKCHFAEYVLFVYK